MSLCSARTKSVITLIIIALIATMSLPASTYAASKAKVYKSGNYKVTVNYKDSKPVSVNVIGEAKSLSKSLVVPQKLKVKLKLKSAKKAKTYNLPIVAIKGIKLKSGSYIDLTKCTKLKTVNLASSETIRYKGYILKTGKAGEISVKGKFDYIVDYSPYEFFGRKVTSNALLPKDPPILGSGFYGWGHNIRAEISTVPTANAISAVNGTTIYTQPTRLTHISNVKSISNSGLYTLVLKTDGTVWAWGTNNYGQLGNGTKTLKVNLTPTQVSGISDVISIAAGDATSFAVKSDGSLWAWGDNTFGALCDEIDWVLTPTKINAISSVKEVSSSGGTVAVLKTDGTVWTWGRNEYEVSLGRPFESDSEYDYSPTPGAVDNMTGVVSISHTTSGFFAIKSDGTVWHWGYPHLTCSDFSFKAWDYKFHKPTQIAAASEKIKKIEAGSEYLILLKTDGSVWGSGSNVSGQLSFDQMIQSGRPVIFGRLTQLKQFKGVSDIFAGRGTTSYAIVK